MKKIYPYDEHVLDTLGATIPFSSELAYGPPNSWHNRPASPRTRAAKLVEFLDKEWQAETTEAGREAIAEARAVAVKDLEG